MFIKEVCIDGFKSYAKPTIVKNFDPKFNAITGLNGSGKSNILDSICFVLGITNLQQVRAGSLQDLVYKQGQAGINKATVSITFDNEDKTRSPLGYEEYPEITVTREIVIGGRNKYKINGKVVQPGNVQNLFHSVQLNVNNPHFLIMQGRITKVLNMKPPEILSMLEEAAGTRMYESKKESAVKTLEKKQTKVDEIDQVLSQEIMPALEKLRQEKAGYNLWIQGNLELEKMKRFVTAFQYFSNEAKGKELNEQKQQLEEKLEDLERFLRDFETLMADMNKNLSALAAQKEKEMGPEMRDLIETVDVLSKGLVKVTTLLGNKEEVLDSGKKGLEKLKCEEKDLTKSHKERQELLVKFQERKELAKVSFQTASNELSEAEDEVQAIQSGKSSISSSSMEEELRAVKGKVVESRALVQKLGLKINHMKGECAEKKKLLRLKEKERVEAEGELRRAKGEVEVIEKQLKGLNFNEELMKGLVQERRECEGAVKSLRSQVMEMEGKLNLGFSFTDPEKGFDRSRVKGIVGRLVKPKNTAIATALEVVAGSKLHNVIVDNEKTGKLLLEKGQLKRRVTLIPLNKIQSSHLKPALIERAEKLVGKENVEWALSGVEFQEDLRPAMSFVFGGHLICKDSATAQKLAFHPEIMAPCVTLQGDLVSPSGLITGGSRKSGGTLLASVGLLKETEAKHLVEEAKLRDLNRKLEGLSKAESQFRQLKEALELKSHKLGLLEEKLRQSEAFQLGQKVEVIEKELDESSSAQEEAKKEENGAKTRADELEKAILEHVKGREGKLKKAEAKVKEKREKKAMAAKEMREKEGDLERGSLEVEEGEREIQGLRDQVESAESGLRKIQEEVEALKKEVAKRNIEFEERSNALEEKREKILKKDGEIDVLQREIRKLKEKQEGVGVEKKKIGNSLKQLQSDLLSSQKTCQDLQKRNRWISAEKALFGKEGSEYDFQGKDLSKVMAELEGKQASQQSVEKRVNKRVLAMFEKAELQYGGLLRRKGKLQHDKAAIVEAIQDLDREKRETLLDTWKKVTKDFGSIFSTLLPGTTAKLEPPEGEPEGFMAGLEVRVAFGGVWKQSLSELSGGQRSLLALSLILALLLYKPAPLYILDEVDAALDLSHTQNIGRMIKRHFPHSQFVVVSLKEGMFANANVLFRTKFVDGVSTVTRMRGTGASDGTSERTDRSKGRNEGNGNGFVDQENTDPNILL